MDSWQRLSVFGARWAVVGAAVMAAALAGCAAPPASQGGFDSDNPAAILYAIRRAGDQRDAAAVPDLVACLDNDDPAVRMMAIGALDRITGTRMDYDPYAEPEQRQVAAQRWAQAVREGRFDAAPPTGGEAPQ